MSTVSPQPLATELPLVPTPSPSLPHDAVTALWRGQVIEAVKLVRVDQHVNLEEARNLVDAYVLAHPALTDRIRHVQGETREGLLRWLLFLAIGGIGLYVLLI